ncbi:MAG: serine hydrolase domain-containing protein [Caulobacter sp.]|nr:serine hydrolase domain-containing protein [Caulobacter sp.]
MKRHLPVVLAALVISSSAAVYPAIAAPCPKLDPVFSRWAGVDTPGFAVAVVADGHVICEQAYGKADLATGVAITPDTRFNLASLTKPFLALAAVDVARGGALGLDAPLARVLPGAAPYYQSVTTRQMLSHTSGVPDIATLIVLSGHSSAEPLENGLLRALIDRQGHLNFPPGDRYLYSNSGYLLTAAILEQATGQSYADLMADRVFRPAGMVSPRIYAAPGQSVAGAALSYGFDAANQSWRPIVYASAAHGSSNLYASADDVARWASYFLKAASHHDPRVAEMTRPAPVKGGTAPYGLGLEVIEYRGRTLWMHTGSEAGYRTVLLMFPEINAAVVVLGNASVRPQPLAEAVADMMFGDDFPAASPHTAVPPTLAVDPSMAAAFSGFYELEPGRVAQVAYADNRVFVAIDPIGMAAFDAISERRLLHRGSGVTVTFENPGTDGFETLRLSGIGAPSVGRRVAVAKTDPTALGRLAGRYISPALGATYELGADEHGLSLTMQGQTEPLSLTALADGKFVSAEAGATIEFVDDTTFLLSTWRVNDIRFARAPQEVN